MEYVTLGRTGIRVSSLCFGTMSFGGAADDKTSEAMYRRCRTAGINFFDCADVYSNGAAERILGRLAAQERNHLVITTKVGFPMGEDPNDQGLSKRHILQSVEASLRRLSTDWIDVLFLHRFDASTPLDVTLDALDCVVRQGKVLHIGVSNWAAWQVARGLGISERHQLERISCIQPMYNLVKRQAEVEILPLAKEERLGVITYSPLGGGLLTGKYGTDRRPDRGRLVENKMYGLRYGEQRNFEVADRLAALAADQGVPPATLAVAWAKSHPAVTAPIIGARNVAQLDVSLAAAEFPMTGELYRRISALSPTPPPATDRTEEREGVTYKGSSESYR